MTPLLSPISEAKQRKIFWSKRREVIAILVLASFLTFCASNHLRTSYVQQQYASYENGLITDHLNDSLSQNISQDGEYKERPFYNNRAVNTFRNEFRKSRVHLNETKTLVFTGSAHGLGSFINTLLMSFEYAMEPHIQRQFHIDTRNWGYGSWNDFFSDSHLSTKLPDGTTVPFVLDSEENLPTLTTEGLKTTIRLYRTKNGQPKYDIKEVNKVPFQHFGIYVPDMPFFDTIYNLQQRLTQHVPRKDLIMRRRVLAQAIWDLKPHLRQRLENILRNEVGGKYVACHIRRGDKIAIGEMADLKMDVYVDGILKHTKYNDPTIKTLVIISDDKEAVARVRSRLEKLNQIHYFTRIISWDDMYFEKYLNGTHGIPRNGWKQSGFLSIKKETRKAIAETLILGITMLAKSDYLVCTFSSNICRLAQVLREQEIDTVFSLDWLWASW